MADSVFDTSFLAKANGATSGKRPGNMLHLRLVAIEGALNGAGKIRYNYKLIAEYETIVREHRNDIISLFFDLLDSNHAVSTKCNLSSPDKSRANDCRWPTHDQHVLAAAVGGEKVVIHVTENALGACAARVKRIFGFKVIHLPG